MDTLNVRSNGQTVKVVNMAPPGVRRPLYADLSVPLIRDVIEGQAGSTFRTIPWTSLTSWNGWRMCPDGIEYQPVIHVTSSPPAYARYPWSELPVDGRFHDARWLIPAAINNGIISHSTFASTEHVSSKKQAEVLAGYRRIIHATVGVKL